MAFGYVQSTSSQTASGSTESSRSATLSNVVPGSLLAFGFSAFNADKAASNPVTSSPSLTWTGVAPIDNYGSFGNCLYLYYALAAAGGSYTVTGAVTIATSIGVVLGEYGAVSPVGTQDQSASATGTGTGTATATTGTTVQRDELVVCVLSTDNFNNAFTAGSSLTSREQQTDSNNSQAIALGDKVVTTTGAQTGSWTFPAVNWGVIVATFSGALPPPWTPTVRVYR